MKLNDPEFIKKILLSLASVIFFILVVEIVLRLTYPFLANYNTEMARYAKELKVIIDENFFRHRPNKAGTYYGVEIKTNSMGWREDKGYQSEKPSEVKRLIVLGDSITLGWGVESSQAYPKVLEKLLNSDTTLTFKYEVINTGVGNYNTRLELEMLKRTLAYNPDIIILGYSINDAEMWHKQSAAALVLGNYSYLYGFLWDKLFNIGNKLGINKNYKKYYQKLYTSDNKGKSQFENSFSTIVSIAKERRSPLIFLNIPDLHKTNPYPFNEINDYIENLVSTNNIPYLNLLDAVKGIKPTRLWVSDEDPHPNATAHSIYANKIYHFLKEGNLIE
jgi:lysophospholipase L1-like esterase